MFIMICCTDEQWCRPDGSLRPSGGQIEESGSVREYITFWCIIFITCDYIRAVIFSLLPCPFIIVCCTFQLHQKGTAYPLAFLIFAARCWNTEIKDNWNISVQLICRIITMKISISYKTQIMNLKRLLLNHFSTHKFSSKCQQIE